MTANRIVLILLGLTLAAGVLLAPRGGGLAEEDAAPTGEDALAKAIERGKALFHDPELGTRGRACAKCHADPNRPKLSLAERADTYPKWDRREKRVITLGRKINQMIMRMLGGQSGELGSDRLVALESYLMSISRDR